MAFYDQEQDENQQSPNAQPGTQVSSSSAVITGGGGSGGQVGAQGAGAPKTNAPDRPGNFVNLQDYLNANKTQASKLGDQASGVINQSADTARQGVNSLNQEAQQKIQPAQSLSSDVSQKIKNNAEALTPEERSQVKNTEKATYQGPSSYADLSSYQSASDANQKASQNIANSGTEQGRMGLISQINSKPRTQGMNVFDNALLQSGGGREKLSQAASANQDINGSLGAATAAIQNKIGRADDPSTPDVDESAGAIGQTNKAQADSYKQVQDALSSWQSGFQPKVSQAQQNLTDLQNRTTKAIATDPYHLRQEQEDLLGLKNGDRLYNVNLGDYLNQASPTDINAANVATPEDYARYGALADLAGDTSNYLDQSNLSQAGKTPGLTANTEKLQSDLDSAQRKYQNDYSTQTTGVLNSAAPPGAGSWESLGSLTTGHTGLGQATPEQLEAFWLPQLESVNASGTNVSGAISAIKSSLDQWRANQGYNNILNPDQQEGTFNGGIRQKF